MARVIYIQLESINQQKQKAIRPRGTFHVHTSLLISIHLMSTFVEKNIEVICGRKVGSTGMHFTVKNDEFRVRTAKKAAG